MYYKIVVLSLLLFCAPLFAIKVDKSIVTVHQKTFPAFIKDLQVTISWLECVPSWCTKMCNGLGSLCTEYEVDIEELLKITDFFNNQSMQKKGIERLKETQNINYLNRIFTYVEQHGNSRKSLETAIRIESTKRMPNPNIRTPLYYECIACNLFAIHVYESLQKK